MVFDGDFSQLVKTLGKIYFQKIREHPCLLGNGDKKNLLEGFEGVGVRFTTVFEVENERNTKLN